MAQVRSTSERFHKYEYWGQKSTGIFVPRTVNGVLKNGEKRNFSSSDCTQDPCSCTGCSEWD